MIGHDISDYLYEIQAQGRYAISLHELMECFGPNEKAIAQSDNDKVIHALGVSEEHFSQGRYTRIVHDPHGQVDAMLQFFE